VIIRSAEFIKSALRLQDFPDFTYPEVAFAGRSNVGKSSLINTLLNRKDLVRTSRRPGQTQTLNFFLVNQALVLVDLPGYGFSKASKEVIRKYHEATITYLENRKALVLVVLLLDIRRRPNAEDKAFFDQAHFLDQGPLVVMTKVDTVGREARKKAWGEIIETVGRPSLNPVFFSARTREGKEEIWKGIEAKAETFRLGDRP
jgi:GTP-binding protein